MHSILIFLLIVSGAKAFAQNSPDYCQVLKTSSWNWNSQKLVNEVQNIFVGKLLSKEKTKKEPTVGVNGTDTGFSWHNYTEWKIEVVRSLKGKYKPGEVASIISLTIDLPHLAKHDGTCIQALNFEAGKDYLIFEGSYHPLGYKALGTNDPWELEVRKLFTKK